MDARSHAFLSRERGFTLVELLVALAILLLILVVTVQVVNGTSNLTQQSRARIDAFQEARAGFESMTRKLSQAILNTYWDYTPAPPATPTGYARQSQLHFVSGQANSLLATVNGASGQPLKTVTQAVFFQAMLGYTATATSTVRPPGLLNACGYYLEFGTDASSRPAFLQGAASIPVRYRFRLSEMVQPTENLEVYADVASGSPAQLNNWFIDPLNATTPPKHTLAENVVALVILPQRSPNDPSTPAMLAPAYAYDSRLYQTQPAAAMAAITRNQLPPMVQVTMVVLDEVSAARLQQRQPDPTQPPALGLGNLFQDNSSGTKYAQDLTTLEATLTSQRLNYRVFSTNVNIQQAKWSQN